MKRIPAICVVLLSLALVLSCIGCARDASPATTPSNLIKTTPDNHNTPTFTWSPASDAGSGVAYYLVRTDSGSFVNIGNVASYSVLMALSEGSHTFEVKAVDNTGNQGTAASLTFFCGGMTTAYAFGDSITEGGDCSYPYAAQFCDENSWDLNNLAHGGDEIMDMAARVYAVDTTATMISFGFIGTNDSHKPEIQDGTHLDVYAKGLLAVSAWLTIPDTDKKRANRAGDITWSGRWSYHPGYGGAFGKCTIRQNDMATFVCKGTTVYIATIGGHGNTGQFSVTVDGASKGTYDCSPSYALADSGLGYTPKLIRIDGLANTDHTVVVTKSNSGGFVALDWAAGNALTTRPRWYLGNIFRHDLSTDATVATLNRIILGVFNDLTSDDLDVRFADSFSRYLYPSDAEPVPPYNTPYHIHPNCTGHYHIYQAFSSATLGPQPP